MRVIPVVLGTACHNGFDPMDAYSTDRAILTYSDAAPVLIAGSSDRAIAHANLTVNAFGLRVAGECKLSEAAHRLNQQASASAIWVELDGSGMEDLPDEFIARLNSDVSSGRYGAVVSAPSLLIDSLAGALDDDVQLIIDADDAERASALALALAHRSSPERYSDVVSDRNAERLRQLSDEVSRIASTLARLSTGPATAPPPIIKAANADALAVSADTIRSIIRARRLRARYFQEELFADPAWDMLLDLLQAEISQLRVPVSSLCIAAAVPATTALRWLKTMVQQGLFIRRADPHDGRRVFVELAPEASRALRNYFAEVGPVAVI
jgi:DNA-binding MarR family transcriptional regulator